MRDFILMLLVKVPVVYRIHPGLTSLKQVWNQATQNAMTTLLIH